MGLKAREATKTGFSLERTMRSRLEPRCSFAKSAASPRLPTTTMSGIGLELGDRLDDVADPQHAR